MWISKYLTLEKHGVVWDRSDKGIFRDSWLPQGQKARTAPSQTPVATSSHAWGKEKASLCTEDNNLIKIKQVYAVSGFARRPFLVFFQYH